jgi:NAD(P)H-dependent FMN reductase
MSKVGIIIGSTRPTRIGPMITKCVLSSITVKHSLDFEVIDLAEWDLPLLNEPEMPAKGEYKYDKTKEWSKKINSKDGFIFVTPQYNWGYPAALKNAIDYLYKEWSQKPAIIVSYANRGGGKAANQLRQVLQGIHMNPTETMPAIQLKELHDEEGNIKDDPIEFSKKYSNDINKAILEFLELQQQK